MVQAVENIAEKRPSDIRIREGLSEKEMIMSVASFILFLNV